jgi:CBS domain containing-hemolysin-like protein
MGDASWVWLAVQAGLLMLFVALSGAFSGSETVLFSLTRVQIEENSRSSNPLRRIAARLMLKPQRTLLVVLLANTAVNVLIFASSYVLAHGLEARLGGWITPAAAVLSILLVMICGEVVPKILGTSLADRLAPHAALLVNAVAFVFEPVGRFLSAAVIEPFTRLFFGNGAVAGMHEISTEELKALLDVSGRRGVIYPLENDLLRNVVDLQQIRVRDAMVPRVEVRAYDVNEPSEGLRELMRETRLKKIPVYDGSIDNIIGLIYAKLLFLDPDRPLRDSVLPVRFVPEIMSCEQLLRHFRQTRTQLAIAVDEYGGMAGLITLEDVLEIIVGDIRDPEDPAAEPEIVPLDGGDYDVSGRLSIRYWAEAFGVGELNQRVATLGGLVAGRLGRPAKLGDVVRIGNVELTVAKVTHYRIDRLRLRLLTPEPARDDGEARA